jgi:hypothetical protein
MFLTLVAETDTGGYFRPGTVLFGMSLLHFPEDSQWRVGRGRLGAFTLDRTGEALSFFMRALAEPVKVTQIAELHGVKTGADSSTRREPVLR